MDVDLPAQAHAVVEPCARCDRDDYPGMLGPFGECEGCYHDALERDPDEVFE